MTPITLIMAYYENAGMLREHARLWRSLPEDIRANLSVVVVDDCSQESPALEALADDCHFGVRSFELWRMERDVRWNQDACRNVGVREAGTKWVLLTDMDHVVPVETWHNLMTDRLNHKKIYRPARVSAPAMDPYKPHPNSWVMTCKTYWRLGGYDEELAGNYGTDGDFLNRARRVAELVDLPYPLIRYPREVIPDASTRNLQRKSWDDKQRINCIVAGRPRKGWEPTHFAVPCVRLL